MPREKPGNVKCPSCESEMDVIWDEFKMEWINLCPECGYEEKAGQY